MTPVRMAPAPTLAAIPTAQQPTRPIKPTARPLWDAADYREQIDYPVAPLLGLDQFGQVSQ
jgi:hypothetical protein